MSIKLKCLSKRSPATEPQQLTLNAPVTSAADDIHKNCFFVVFFFFFFFSEKIRIDISCECSARHWIHMKH